MYFELRDFALKWLQDLLWNSEIAADGGGGPGRSRRSDAAGGVAFRGAPTGAPAASASGPKSARGAAGSGASEKPSSRGVAVSGGMGSSAGLANFLECFFHKDFLNYKKI